MGKRHILYTAMAVCIGILLLAVPVRAGSSAPGDAAAEKTEETQNSNTNTIHEDEVPKSEGKLIVGNSRQGVLYVSIFAGVLIFGAAVTAIYHKHVK